MIERRTFLAGSAATAGVAALATSVAAPAEAASPFRHGVASGDPLPTRVVLWTRVTPTEASTPGSGRGPRVLVTWQVSTSSTFRTIAASGSMWTGPERDHTVKVDAGGLKPGVRYWYRFRLNGVTSPVGRTKTAPAKTAHVDRLRFALVSCSNWEAGYFSAYRHLAARGDLDAVLHMGDYIYEYGTGAYAAGENGIIRATVPTHEIITLADYRKRHAQYKTDADLKRLHALVPWITTWDDHESANNSWSGGAENHTPEKEGSWAARKAAAQTAYDEWMPVRLQGTAVVGDGARIYRSFQFGQLADLSMLDLRSYRTEQPLPIEWQKITDPNRTIMGKSQLSWLKGKLSETDATWKLVGNSVMVTPLVLGRLDTQMQESISQLTGQTPMDGQPFNTDAWDGYQADRRDLIDHLGDEGIQNTIFLTGDIHTGWACELPYNTGRYPATDKVGVELVCASVTSDNVDDALKVAPRTLSLAAEGVLKATNPYVKYVDLDSHGYSVLTLTPGKAHMDWYVLSDRTKKDATSRWSRGYVVKAGTNTLQRVWGPSA